MDTISKLPAPTAYLKEKPTDITMAILAFEHGSPTKDATTAAPEKQFDIIQKDGIVRWLLTCTNNGIAAHNTMADETGNTVCKQLDEIAPRYNFDFVFPNPPYKVVKDGPHGAGMIQKVANTSDQLLDALQTFRSPPRDSRMLQKRGIEVVVRDLKWSLDLDEQLDEVMHLKPTVDNDHTGCIERIQLSANQPLRLDLVPTGRPYKSLCDNISQRNPGNIQFIEQQLSSAFAEGNYNKNIWPFPQGQYELTVTKVNTDKVPAYGNHYIVQYDDTPNSRVQTAERLAAAVLENLADRNDLRIKALEEKLTPKNETMMLKRRKFEF